MKKHRTERNPLSWWKFPPDMRSLGDEADLRLLAQSYLKRPIHPLIAMADGTGLDGNRRVAGLLLLGQAEAEFTVTDEPLTPAQIAEIRVISAVHRRGLTDWERFVNVKAIADANPSWTRKQLAEYLDIGSPVVTHLLTEGIPGVEEAFKAGGIPLAKRYELAKGTPEQQEAQLAAALNGATRDDLVRERKRVVTPDAPKARSIQIILESGVTVVFKGREISLNTAISAVAEADRELARAKKNGHDARTLAALMKKRKKARAAT